ncbi:MAG: hypothetical protein C4532_20135 [Candidatus Abyssobacteria bacterium SURF_17]|uniref:Mannosylglycerate hydrolase MGH1-like glycoside hydrolase domain-containing protein n=1 Tax=Candidatus Abyssobacteria bacterium SURF_17 TaxID=2093361 RepID=A0A419EMU3_9BACT|nr:MAG: hypothetical protein C4532_20135 [Candidatus Abyssubacteria bacterium SURF_17]
MPPRNHPQIGWNTYDPLGMNRIVRFPELYEVRISVFAPESGSYASKFYFLEHFGDVGNALRAEAHSPDCSFASANLSFAGFTFKVEYACSQDGTLACSVTPLAVADPFTLVMVEVLRAWELEGEVELTNNVISFPSASGRRIVVSAIQEHSSIHNTGTRVTSGVYPSEEEYLNFLLEQRTLNGLSGKGKIAALGFIARIPLTVAAWTENKQAGVRRVVPSSHATTELVRANKETYETESPSIRGGPFEGCHRAATSVANWMTVWDQLHEIPYSPVTRSWIDNYMVRAGFDPSARGPLTGLWDCFFHALLHSVNDQSLAEGNIRVVLDDHALMDTEYPTNYIVSTYRSGDRSQPPLGSLATWKLYRRFGNKALLEWAYPRLKRWHSWWKRRRDGNGDGLLEWGSNLDVAQPGNDAGTLFAAACESGMDNSPLYDEASYDAATGTMNLADVGLNALHAADTLFLSRIADALGRRDESEALETEHRALCERINASLWDEKTRTYANRFWNGNFSTRLAPMSFYPLLAHIPETGRAQELVQLHLLNEREFWGEFVIPTISKDDPAFMDQLYWRGRIWPPVNYLIYLGLKAYRLDEVAFELACRSVRLFMKEWNLRGHCHENYNAITGEGDDVPVAASPGSNGSDRFYTWGALLALMGVEELFDVELGAGIRFGCRFLQKETVISNVRCQGESYSVKTSFKETTACRNGAEFFSSTPGTSVRNYTASKEGVEFFVAGSGTTSLAVSGFDPRSPVTVTAGGHEPFQITADAGGKATFSSNLTGGYTHIALKRTLV